ncbi:MAG: HNH endonuclease [Anaerolineae bacterium]|nr:HNH endonuclease [Anaerolineae bacterium]
MQRVFVLDTNYQPLMPCHPARAKELLDKRKAAVFRRFPFTIILKYAVTANNQPVQVKVDPGSRVSGIVLVAQFRRGWRVIWAAELHHRGQIIRDKLLKRRQQRRSRRSRKTRHRQPRFDNRRRPKGWLPPSLQSRVDNLTVWITRLYRFAPVDSISLELAKFDTQALQNPEIEGVEYQRGTLFGYEIWEYLLEKWGRQCVYCGAENVPLEKEHIVPKSRGGSNRVSNLTVACHPCNQEKGDLTAEEFGFPHVHARAKRSLKDAAAINATRWTLWRWCDLTGLPVEVGTGGHTKYNRTQQDYPKTHWIDAACVGDTGESVWLDPNMHILTIRAMGRQSRQMCRVDKYGFPRTKSKQRSRIHGFQTGGMVHAVVPAGKKTSGTHVGRVAVRAQGSFRVGTTDGINWQYCTIVHLSDGYHYERSSAVSSQA